MTFATIGGQVYGANDWDPMFVWDGVAGAKSDAGIATAPQTWAPSPTASSGDPSAGTHSFRYRYKQSATGYVSNPSNSISVTTTAGSTQLSFAIAASGTGNVIISTDGKVDQIVLEATLLDGGTFFEAAVATNASGSVVFNLTDSALGANTLDYEDVGHGVPPHFMVVEAHLGRLFGLGRTREQTGTAKPTNGSTAVVGTGTDFTQAAVGRMFHSSTDQSSYEIASVTNATALVLAKNYTGATPGSPLSYEIRPKNPNLLFCSEALLPESWNPLSFVVVLKSMNDTATALLSFGNLLLVCGSHSIEKFSFTNEPFLTKDNRLPDGQLFPVSSVRGVANNNCIVEAEGTVYGFDSQGMWSWTGSKPMHVSAPVDHLLLDSNSTSSLQSMVHMSWHPRERKIRVHYNQGNLRAIVGTVGIGDCDAFVEYDVDTKEWGAGTHGTPMSSSCSFQTTNFGSHVLYGDILGYYWMPDGSGNRLDGVLSYDFQNPTTHHRVKATVAASPTPLATGFTINETGLDIADPGGTSLKVFEMMSGAPCYSVSLGQTAQVATNTTNAVTLHADASGGVGFTGAPTAGSTVYFGYIPAAFTTGWLNLSEEWEISEPRHIHLFFEPGAPNSDAKMYVVLRVDPSNQRDLVGTTVTTGFSDWVTRSEDGISFTNGDPKILVDMDRSGTGAGGYRKIPIGTKSWRYIEILVGLHEPPADTWWGPVIHRIEVDGYTYEVPVGDD
tara:strand:+ start:1566 stop:3746 length:2181 start_codon:yes stop_codon:yes gene_type:complete